MSWISLRRIIQLDSKVARRKKKTRFGGQWCVWVYVVCGAHDSLSVRLITAINCPARAKVYHMESPMHMADGAGIAYLSYTKSSVTRPPIVSCTTAKHCTLCCCIFIPTWIYYTLGLVRWGTWDDNILFIEFRYMEYSWYCVCFALMWCDDAGI